MSSGTLAYWQRLQRAGFEVPTDRPLDDLTAELTVMLGSPSPEVRDGTALPALATWIERGVYDDLLGGLGDGMAAGLLVGIGEVDTDTVFRRSFSALGLVECLARNNEIDVLPAGKVLEWGDRATTWLLRERDVRGWVEGKGWAHAVAHGADAVAVLAASRHLDRPELTVLLDVVADRLDAGTPVLGAGEHDRLAGAVMQVLRRDLLDLAVLEPWLVRLARSADAHALAHRGDPFAATANAQGFLRALFVQLSLSPRPPAIRSDLVLSVIDALRLTNAPYLAVRGARSH